jgi:hypothetical protein
MRVEAHGVRPSSPPSTGRRRGDAKADSGGHEAHGFANEVGQSDGRGHCGLGRCDPSSSPVSSDPQRRIAACRGAPDHALGSSDDLAGVGEGEEADGAAQRVRVRGAAQSARRMRPAQRSPSASDGNSDAEIRTPN